MRLKHFGTLAGFITVALLPAAANLLLTLVLVRGLGIAGFATWAIIEPTILIFATIAALGTQYGVLFTTAGGTTDPRKALGVAMTAALPFALVASSVVWAFVRRTIPDVGYVNLVLPLSAETMAVLTVASLRGQRLLSIWIFFESVRSMGLLLLAFAFLKLLPHAVGSVNNFLLLRGVLTSSAVIGAAIFMRLRPGFDRGLIVRMVAYGLPIAGAALIQLVTNSADRFLLAGLHRPAAEIALYAAHQRLAGILSVLAVTPINLWFAVEAIRRDTDAEAEFFRGVLLCVLGLLALMMIAAFFAGPIIWPYLFPTIAFHPVIYALLAASVVPQALGIVTNIGGLREKKTHLNTIVVILSAATVLALGVPLIPIAAAIGAAVARFAATVVQAVAGRILSQRIAPVSHRFQPLVPFLVAMILATMMLFSNDFGMSSWPFFAASIGATAVGAYINRNQLRLLMLPSPAATV